LIFLLPSKATRADHGVLHHRHHNVAAGPADLHVLEQPGRDQRLETIVDSRLIELPGGLGCEIGANRLGLHAAIAFNHDRFSGLRRRRLRQQHQRK